MERFVNQLVAALGLLILVWSCGPKNDPEPAYPSYLRIPASLTGYTGSGRISINGGLSLLAEGPEELNSSTKTYSGVRGSTSLDDIAVQFTVGQPLPYAQTASVPAEYRSSGVLRTRNAVSPGTYPIGIDSPATPTGALADLIVDLPGPQLYFARSGNLTIKESTVIRTEGTSRLYRIQGDF